ncbi:MAG: Gfo/Idh/MocA family oxidoreductase [bacterium]
MSALRFGIVGLGAIGEKHARGLAGTASRDCVLGAVACANAENADRLSRELGVPGFHSAESLFASGTCDAVILATPHFLHPPLAIQAARAGLHVLSEKPLGVTVGPAREAAAACRKHKVALGVMFQQRLRPAVKRMRQLLATGKVGELVRVEATCSSWTRTQAYYAVSPWRGTWNGEGGGVLMNQAPHTLDLFIALGGMPTSVYARLATRIHKIEVENTAEMLYGYENAGKFGHLYVTTAQAPGVEHLLLVGEKASLELGQEGLRMARLPKSLHEHLLHSPQAGSEAGLLNAAWEPVVCDAERDDYHIQVAHAFARHVLKGAPMVADADDGIRQVEMTNAAYLSGHLNRPVTFPIHGVTVERLLSKRIDRSSRSGQGLHATAMAAMRELKRREYNRY